MLALDDRGLQAELRRADRRDIAAGARAEDDEVEVCQPCAHSPARRSGSPSSASISAGRSLAGERIANGHTAMHGAVLHVLGEQHRAAGAARPWRPSGHPSRTAARPRRREGVLGIDCLADPTANRWPSHGPAARPRSDDCSPRRRHRRVEFAHSLQPRRSSRFRQRSRRQMSCARQRSCRRPELSTGTASDAGVEPDASRHEARRDLPGRCPVAGRRRRSLAWRPPASVHVRPAGVRRQDRATGRPRLVTTKPCPSRSTWPELAEALVRLAGADLRELAQPTSRRPTRCRTL